MIEANIIKSEVIVINEVGQNTYGDLTFTDKGGTAYKISNKRKPYFEKVIIPNTAVQLNYAMSSFGKEFIYSAVSVDLPSSPGTEPQPLLPSHQKEINHATRVGKAQGAEISGQATGMITKEIGDMIRAGVMVNKSAVSILKALYGEEIAVNIVKWYRSQTLGITRIEFDGTKLPKLTPETPKES